MIRQEKVRDYAQISDLIKQAFANVEGSNQKEYLLVEQLRLTEAYIPELAIVYIDDDGEVLGHIMYSECFIGEHPILVLGPLSVLAGQQGKGIATQLIEASLERAKWSGFSAILAQGEPEFYAPFGFEKASEFNISAPFNLTQGEYLLLPLYKDSLRGIEGTVKYAQPFYDNL